MWEPGSPFLAQFMPIVTQPPTSGEYTTHHPLDPKPPSAPESLSSCGRTSKMTRGRKKDLTIPPTRALVQQRDYRARRAQYVADLEDRVRKAEEENIQLRSELAVARSGQAPPPLALDSQTAQASSELLHSLSVASASLARFHQLAFPEQQDTSTSRPSAGLSNHPFSQRPAHATNLLRPASFPSPAPSPPYAYPPSIPSATHSYSAQPRRKRLYREDSPESVVTPSGSMGYSHHGSRSISPMSECCGGIMDCRDLIEQVNSGANDVQDSPRPHIRPLPSSPDYPSQPSRHDIQRY